MTNPDPKLSPRDAESQTQKTLKNSLQLKASSIDKSRLNESYIKTLSLIRKQMNPTDKLMSQILHQPIIDNISGVVSKTIARPRPLLIGSIMAFLAAIVCMVLVSSTDYRPTGSEISLSFLIGWSLGIVIDYASFLIKGK
ncbi:hypothetical protein HGB24_00320 [Candidatus Saccharibacteria bacterium]|nr:hypothetical protein [Candidatus Saccharibacteria bacterium]